MKSLASESKPFQSHSKGEILGQARQKKQLSHSKLKQAILIDSDAELFMYLIQSIRFSSWKVWHLKQALLQNNEIHVYHTVVLCCLKTVWYHTNWNADNTLLICDLTTSIYKLYITVLHLLFIPANFFWVKCTRFSSCHDRDFRKCPSNFWRFPTI